MAEKVSPWRVIGNPQARVGALGLAHPGTPNLADTDAAEWITWVRTVWAKHDVAEAIMHAPSLAKGVEGLCAQETTEIPVQRARKLTSALLRGANLDWFEQGDVWARVA